jgi:hypothetical protein
MWLSLIENSYKYFNSQFLNEFFKFKLYDLKFALDKVLFFQKVIVNRHWFEVLFLLYLFWLWKLSTDKNDILMSKIVDRKSCCMIKRSYFVSNHCTKISKVKIQSIIVHFYEQVKDNWELWLISLLKVFISSSS